MYLFIVSSSEHYSLVRSFLKKKRKKKRKRIYENKEKKNRQSLQKTKIAQEKHSFYLHVKVSIL